MEWPVVQNGSSKSKLHALENMVIPTELVEVLACDPDVISGAVRFRGTRVPLQALLDTLEVSTLEEFLHGWPDVTREQAEAVIRWQQNEARKVFGLDLAG